MVNEERPEVLAIIPARGGSKSIPRKNLLALAGKPLIAYSIQQALVSRYITRTIVSTDDDEIAVVAREFGAEIPFMRPAEFAQDLSPDIDVFRHALEWLRSNSDYVCELVVHLRPTGPVRRVELIDEAIKRMLGNPNADSLRSVSQPLQTPFKMWKINEEYLEPLLTLDGLVEPYNLPRQQLPQVYWQNGYVDIVRPAIVLNGSMCGQKIMPFVVEEPMLEIDYIEDLEVVEAAVRKQEQMASPQPQGGVKRHSV